MAASLTRGISFRRQGSSGLIWNDSLSFPEEGVVVGGGALSISIKEAGFPSSSSSSSFAPGMSAGRASTSDISTSVCSEMVVLKRSLSAGNSSPAFFALDHHRHRPRRHYFSSHKSSSFRLVRWLKKALVKIRH